MKALVALLLMAPAAALAQYQMNVIAQFGVAGLTTWAQSNPSYIWTAQPLNGIFTITGFATLAACQAYNPATDLGGVMMDGVPIPAVILSAICYAVGNVPVSGGGGLPQAP